MGRLLLHGAASLTSSALVSGNKGGEQGRDMSSIHKGASKAAGLNVSVLSRSPSGLGLYRSLSSPFSSPRKGLASPSILRRKSCTPTGSNSHKLVGHGLPSLPAVIQPEEKDVQSIVLSPHWQQPLSQAERVAAIAKEARPQSSRDGGAIQNSIKGRGKKTTWSGRVFVKFATEEEDEVEPQVTLSHVLKAKRKREAYETSPRQPPRQAPIRDHDEEQFSSNVSHVLLAMAELKDAEEDVVSPRDTKVDLVSQLLLQAQNDSQEAAQHGTTSDAAITSSPTLNGTADSGVSNGTEGCDLDLDRDEKPSEPERAAQALLESA